MEAKSIAIAVGALIIVIVAAFLFTGGQKSKGDTLIPSAVPVASGLELENKQGTQSAKMENTPFQVLPAEQITGKKAYIKTTKGEIVFELFAEAPIASSNFIALANKGFYNGLTFHRRVEGFVIQGGDPKGDGTGNPGYRFADEPVSRNYTKGIVAMANSGPDTNGSQFFIMLADYELEKNYTIFGQVLSGQEVVDSIQVGDKMTSVTVK